MPAMQFFTVYGEALTQENDERMMHLVALTDISAISLADAKFYESVRKDFSSRLSFSRKTPDASKGLDPTDPTIVAQIEALTMLATRLS